VLQLCFGQRIVRSTISILAPGGGTRKVTTRNAVLIARKLLQTPYSLYCRSLFKSRDGALQGAPKGEKRKTRPFWRVDCTLQNTSGALALFIQDPGWCREVVFVILPLTRAVSVLLILPWVDFDPR